MQLLGVGGGGRRRRGEARRWPGGHAAGARDEGSQHHLSLREDGNTGRALGVLGFGMSGFRLLGFRILGFRILGR